jgi:broad specificity phosphatase PhoE
MADIPRGLGIREPHNEVGNLGPVGLVVLVQHGEKEQRPGDPGLSPHGRQQAAVTGVWLRDNLAVSAVWSSPLKRAVETANSIAEAVRLDVSLDDRLRERMNWDDAAQSIDEFLVAWDRSSQDRNFIPSTGASSNAAARRLQSFLEQFEVTDSGSVVVAVVHGGVTVDLLRTLMGDTPLEAASPGIIRNGVPSCALTQLVYGPTEWVLRSIAWTDHLAAGD